MKSNVSTSTFLSLAILKVDLDEGVSDYLGYLENFAVSLITKYKPDPVTDSELASLFEQEFGLRVPVRGVQLVLRRFAKRGLMKKAHNTYRVTNVCRQRKWDKMARCLRDTWGRCWSG